MDNGEIRHEHTTTEPDNFTGPFLEECADQLANDLGVERDKLSKLGAMITSQQLVSRHYIPALGDKLDVPHLSDDRLTLFWFKDSPAALVIETRDVMNWVDYSAIYFGLRPGQEL